ncbi:MAG: tRNA pseudouridine(55) synthase TruB [SAR202 cluster bacterium]|nr:tRNA pseudouridine(55) synthase TruB [SAR202 cluster bacterium]
MNARASDAAGRLHVHGFLNLNKERGMTSTQVVRVVKRLTRARKVGHGGTLDPEASGVLPVCLGQACRFVDAVIGAGKEYRMTVRLGQATSTYDAEGEVTRTADASVVDRASFEAVLERFRGQIQQVPPMYSALKRAGRPLYELARSGVTVERAPRPVSITKLVLARWANPDVELVVECGRGFYARSLANDIGEALGSAAHLAGLVRTRSGPFRIEESVSVAELERMVNLGNWSERLLPSDFVLGGLRSIVLDPLLEEKVSHGSPVPVAAWTETDAVDGDRVRLYSTEGRFLALARYDPAGPSWRPEKVIPEHPTEP